MSWNGFRLPSATIQGYFESMMPAPRTAILLLFTSLSNGVSAQEPPTEADPAREAVQEDAQPTTNQPRASTPLRALSPTAASETPKDPNGIQGISPFSEALNKADQVLVAHGEALAIDQYRHAVLLMPTNPRGHLRLAELSLMKQDWTAAIQFIVAAKRFSEGDLVLRAQAAFLLAEVHERQGNVDKAIAGWDACAQLNDLLLTQKMGESETSGSASPRRPLPVQIHLDSANARKNIVETKKQMDADYALVVERIKKNQPDATADSSTTKK